MHPLSMNSKGDIQIDINQVRIDILQGISECTDRGLTQTTKWLSELNFALREHKVDYDEVPINRNDVPVEEREAFCLAKSYFDCQEYDRAAHFLDHCSSQKCVFLHKYSQYMSSEKKRLDNATDSSTESTETTQVLLDLLSFFKVGKKLQNSERIYS